MSSWQYEQGFVILFRFTFGVAIPAANEKEQSINPLIHLAPSGCSQSRTVKNSYMTPSGIGSVRSVVNGPFCCAASRLCAREFHFRGPLDPDTF